MAKKAYSPDPKAETIKRIQRTEAYAEKVRQLFAATVNEILALNKSVPTLDEGVMYSFDGDNMRIQKKVEALLRQLHSTTTTAIKKGITLEWEKANDACDKLISSCFGKEVLSSPEFSAWNNRNMAAMNAFANRTENGLNLSKRIWQSVQQLRDEMEIAMTVAIGEGDSAQSISRKVRQYLNDPDLMFRRFRFKKGEDEQGKPIYGRKWKKRIKDEKTGKYRWIDYDRSDYKTGSGVYKSSAKNAMRVARSETNIAYRRADNERWQQMDFVLATGYGRNSLDGLADLQMSELSCHAKGATYLFPDVHTVVDIGGQDVKVIEIENGMMKNFVMNDKCAAGTGRFLDVMARVLEVRVEDLGDLGDKSTKEIGISSTCTVFAESEVISQLAVGTDKCDIIAGIHRSVAGRVSGLCNRVGVRDRVVMTGGVAQNHGIVKALENQLGHEISTSPLTQYNGALGAALFAYQKALKKQH